MARKHLCGETDERALHQQYYLLSWSCRERDGRPWFVKGQLFRTGEWTGRVASAGARALLIWWSDDHRSRCERVHDRYPPQAPNGQLALLDQQTLEK
jgi:hypothetical protein